MQERFQGPEVLRLQLSTEPCSQLSLNQEQHTEQRRCHTTFPIAYEGLSHVPSRSPKLRFAHKLSLTFAVS
jgi:hypothetical protein